MNLFVPRRSAVDHDALDQYLGTLRSDSTRLGVELAPPTWDDDEWGAKVKVLLHDPVPLVTFTFGCPGSEVLEALWNVGSVVVVTVTSPEEARSADAAGVDGLCLQSVTAGGHQGRWSDDEPPHRYETVDLVRVIRSQVDLPLLAAGGLMTGADVAEVLAAGAVAGQLGTAFLLAPEAGTNELHRRALADGRFAETALTRSFSGRWARGLANRFIADHPDAPAAYPEINNATRPLRGAAVANDDPDRLNLWAGANFRFVRERPAAETVTGLVDECTRAVEQRTD